MAGVEQNSSPQSNRMNLQLQPRQLRSRAHSNQQPPRASQQQYVQPTLSAASPPPAGQPNHIGGAAPALLGQQGSGGSGAGSGAAHSGGGGTGQGGHAQAQQQGQVQVQMVNGVIQNLSQQQQGGEMQPIFRVIGGSGARVGGVPQVPPSQAGQVPMANGTANFQPNPNGVQGAPMLHQRQQGGGMQQPVFGVVTGLGAQARSAPQQGGGSSFPVPPVPAFGQNVNSSANIQQQNVSKVDVVVGFDAVHHACHNGFVDVVEVLVNGGATADINQRTWLGMPRPNIVTTPVWQTMYDMPHRKKLLGEIIAIYSPAEAKKNEPGWQKKISDKARQIEAALYKNAKSLAEYNDVNTLRQRCARQGAVLVREQEAEAKKRMERMEEVEETVPTVALAPPGVSIQADPARAASSPEEQKALQVFNHQQRLLLLLHASKCLEDTCATPFCKGIKNVYNHAKNCTDMQCKTQSCISSRTALGHYHSCRDAKCGICPPVREIVGADLMDTQPQDSANTQGSGIGGGSSMNIAGTGPQQMQGFGMAPRTTVMNVADTRFQAAQGSVFGQQTGMNTQGMQGSGIGQQMMGTNIFATRPQQMQAYGMNVAGTAPQQMQVQQNAQQNQYNSMVQGLAQEFTQGMSQESRQRMIQGLAQILAQGSTQGSGQGSGLGQQLGQQGSRIGPGLGMNVAAAPVQQMQGSGMSSGMNVASGAPIQQMQSVGFAPRIIGMNTSETRPQEMQGSGNGMDVDGPAVQQLQGSGTNMNVGGTAPQQATQGSGSGMNVAGTAPQQATQGSGVGMNVAGTAPQQATQAGQGVAQLTEAQRAERQLNKELHMQLLDHVVSCTLQTCTTPDCSRMKALLAHPPNCEVKVQNGCATCKRVWIVLQLHARDCQRESCAVPRCAALKERMRGETPSQS